MNKSNLLLGDLRFELFLNGICSHFEGLSSIQNFCSINESFIANCKQTFSSEGYLIPFQTRYETLMTR